MFFTQQNEKIYLVTNWHVVSGRNADTNVVMSPTGGVPNKLRVYVPKQGSNSTLSFDDDFYMDVDLFDEDDNRLWYEKQENGRMIDVALVPLKETKGVITTIEEAEEPFNEKVPFEITSEIFIIGFPFGKQTGYIPIWKKQVWPANQNWMWKISRTFSRIRQQGRACQALLWFFTRIDP